MGMRWTLGSRQLGQRRGRSQGWSIGASESKICLIVAAAFSLSVSVAVMVTAGADQSRLGAPTFWPWVLTALQVLALWAAGGTLWWGWLLGASVQTPWIAYAIVTEQIGFIPGCVVSTLVQAHSFMESLREPQFEPDGLRLHRRSTAVRRVRPAV
jgi:hypothetical protein